MKLKCDKCSHTWNYRGDMEKYATCPDCKSSVKIEENNLVYEELEEDLNNAEEDDD